MATDPDRDIEAAELALGVLENDAYAAAVARSENEPDFAAQVDQWHERFAALWEDVADEAPPAGVWARIESQLAANDDAPAAAPARVLPWQVATGVFGAAAAALALALVTRPEPVVPPAPPAPAPQVVEVERTGPALVAQLIDADGASMLAVRRIPGSDRLAVRAIDIPEGAGVPELWVIAEGGAPRSLGLIARDGASEVRLGGDLATLFADGATLAVTLEPRAGAPHSAPSGNILGTARITQL